MQRVGLKLDYGVETVRSWLRRTDIDVGVAGDVTSYWQTEIRRLEKENRGL